MLLAFDVGGIGRFELELFVRDKMIDFSLYCAPAYTNLYGEMSELEAISSSLVICRWRMRVRTPRAVSPCFCGGSFSWDARPRQQEGGQVIHMLLAFDVEATALLFLDMAHAPNFHK